MHANTKLHSCSLQQNWHKWNKILWSFYKSTILLHYFVFKKKIGNRFPKHKKIHNLKKLKQLKQKVLPSSETCLACAVWDRSILQASWGVFHTTEMSARGRRNRAFPQTLQKFATFQVVWLLAASFPNTTAWYQQGRLRHPLAAELCFKEHVVSSDWFVYWPVPPLAVLCGRISLYL